MTTDPTASEDLEPSGPLRDNTLLDGNSRRHVSGPVTKVWIVVDTTRDEPVVAAKLSFGSADRVACRVPGSRIVKAFADKE